MTSGQPLAGQVALVTGGARGIGLACAQGLCAAGAAVVIVDRLAQEAQAVARSIAADGSRAVAIVADLAKIQEIPRTVIAAAEAYGRIDVLVNNAGILNQTATEALTCLLYTSDAADE